MTTINPITSTPPESGMPGSSSSKMDPAGAASKETFLKLLVAQIKNQNPLNPADGITFVTQLAQFSQLEQLMEIRSGIDSIKQQSSQEDTLTDQTQQTGPTI